MKSRVLPGLFYFFCFTLPVSPFINTRIQFALVIISVVFVGKDFSIRQWLRQSWDLTLLFLVLLVGLLYSTDRDMGLRQLETSLSLLGLPLIILGIVRLSRPQQVNVFYSFALGIVVASLICLARAFTSYLETGDWSVFFYSRFTKIIDSHPTYFAYYLIFAITYGLYSLYYDLPKKFTTWGIILILFLFVILLLTGGQTAFISLLLTFSFFVSKYLLDQKTKRTSVVAMLVLSLSIGWFGLTFLFQNSDLFRSISDQNDYWERMSLWESAIRANSNPWFGVGTGDYNLILNEYYRSHDMANFASENMNSHNEFIQMYFSNGLVGLAALLLILSRPLYLAVRYQNLLAILLYFPFIVYGITEVFLGRYQGVVFLSFLHQLFVSHSLASKPMTIANISLKL